MTQTPHNSVILHGGITSLTCEQDPYVLSSGKWYICVKSVAFYNLPVCDLCLIARCNLVHSPRSPRGTNPDLSPLYVFKLESAKAGVSIVKTFQDSPYRLINNTSDTIELTFTECFSADNRQRQAVIKEILQDVNITALCLITRDSNGQS